MYGSSGYTLVRIYDAPGCTNLIKSIFSKDKLLDRAREQFGSPAICTQRAVWQSCSFHTFLGSVQLSTHSHQFADHVPLIALVTFVCDLSGSVQLSSRWYLCDRKSPYLGNFSKNRLWNSSNVRLIDNDPLLSFQGRSSSVSSFHASLLQAQSIMMAWCLWPCARG